MNPQAIRRSILLSAFVFGVTVCTGQSNVVYYGANSNALNVMFVDTNLSQTAQSNIVSDLRLCLQEWGKTAELCLWDNEDTAGYLDLDSRSPHYPIAIDFPKDIVSNGTSGVALQIPRELSDAYTNAFAFVVAYSNAVAAAPVFVTFMSSTNFPGIAPADLPNYLLAKNETPEELIANAQDNITELAKRTYYPPSILGFACGLVGPGEPAVSNLWMRVPCSTIDYDDKKSWSEFPAIWHEGRWKISFWMLE